MRIVKLVKWYDMIWYDIWYDMIWYDMIWYDMIYLLTAIGLSPGGRNLTNNKIILAHVDIICKLCALVAEDGR